MRSSIEASRGPSPDSCAMRASGARHLGRGGPRPHDLRHRFAVQTLVLWYRSGADVGAAPAIAVDLSRTCEPSIHLLVTVGHARVARDGELAGREEVTMSTLAPTLQAFFLTRSMVIRECVN